MRMKFECECGLVAVTDGTNLNFCSCGKAYYPATRECANCRELTYKLGVGCSNCKMGIESNATIAEGTIPTWFDSQKAIDNVKRFNTVGMEPIAAVKADTGKPAMHLLPFEALTEVAKVLDFGAAKYDDHNWRKGLAWSRLIAATLRHVFAWASGEDKDSETGLSHLAHAACCILFLLSYEVTSRDRGLNCANDDRWKV